VQVALNNAVSAGLEYRHTDYGDAEYDFPRGHNSPIAAGNTTFSVENNEVLFRVTIWLGHLGNAAPPPVTMPTGKK
jgi:opacity protein-like surface antigen